MAHYSWGHACRAASRSHHLWRRRSGITELEFGNLVPTEQSHDCVAFLFIFFSLLYYLCVMVAKPTVYVHNHLQLVFPVCGCGTLLLAPFSIHRLGFFFFCGFSRSEMGS
jgi:hypothetical protein